MPARLEVVAGKAMGMSILVEGELVIGRQTQGAGRLADDDEISRTHARVALDADGYCAIEDLGSTNGTFVNGVRISAPCTLSEGDTIELGGTIMVVRDLPIPAAGQVAGDGVQQPTVVPIPETPLPAARRAPSPELGSPTPSSLPPTLDEADQAPKAEEVRGPAAREAPGPAAGEAPGPAAPGPVASDADSVIAPPAVLSLRLEVDFVTREATIALGDASEAVHLLYEHGAWRPRRAPDE